MKILSKFKRKKEKPKELSPWGTDLEEQLIEEDKTSFIYYIKLKSFNLVSLVQKRRLERLSNKKPHLRLRKIKRIIVSISAIIYFLIGLVSLSNLTSIFFFLTSYFLIDYLWRTKEIKWINI